MNTHAFHSIRLPISVIRMLPFILAWLPLLVDCFSRQPRIVSIPSHSHEIYCKGNNHLQCWDLIRLSGTTSTRTQLFETIDGEVEIAPVKVNGDSDAFFSPPTSSDDKISVNGYSSKEANGQDEVDAPMATENGGFTHTAASKAKIGAANRGKTPWNKGQQRSEEVKARIAAGVRARNRERFLEKLKGMGLTEEEYEAQKKEERRKKDAERRARRTENGGYRPTDETRAKISKVLKEKHARGEIKRSKVDPSKVRRGFTHSDETKRKISESLKHRWANDSDYRELMTNKMKVAYSNPDVRKKVSNTLKKKWQDPEFRGQMVQKIQGRRRSPATSQEFRDKLSLAMKEKWKDAEYREKTLQGIAKRNESVVREPRPASRPKPKAKKKPLKGSSPNGEVRMMRPLEPGEMKRSVKKVRKVKRKKVPEKRETVDDKGDLAVEVKAINTNPKAKVKKKATKAKTKEPDGSVNRLREERRDLFDLLYGDDDQKEDKDEVLPTQPSVFDLGDEDLDSYDPYGLDDY